MAMKNYVSIGIGVPWLRELSETGFADASFRLPGTGDSADDDETPDRVRAWVESILMRFAPFAVLPGSSRSLWLDCAWARCWRPGGRGNRRFRRTGAARADRIRRDLLSRAARLGEDAGEGAPPHSAAISRRGGLEAAGFVYTPQTIADLRACRCFDRAERRRRRCWCSIGQTWQRMRLSRSASWLRRDCRGGCVRRLSVAVANP